MTYLEILQAASLDLNYQSPTTVALALARLKTYANEGIRRVISEPGLMHLRTSDSMHSFSAVASQARYVVTEAVERIRSIQNRTNNITLRLMPLDEYRRIEPDPTEITGTPSHYVPIGRVAVAVQPSVAARIFADSTAAGDTNTVYVEGLTGGVFQRSVSKVMTGVTAVDVDSTITTWTEVTNFYLSVAAVGFVTLNEAAEGGTELARITIGATRPRYFGFYLWPTPAAADSYKVEYDRRCTDLTIATDEPGWIEDYHWLIPSYIRMREYSKTAGESNANLQRYRDEAAQFADGVNKLKAYTMNPPDYRPQMGKGRPEFSRLGAMYPADPY